MKLRWLEHSPRGPVSVSLCCPRLPPGTFGLCVELCSGDLSCPRGQKCCSNGCGHSCQTTVQDVSIR
uniref:WAP domain-containing protein n=1 Tax=Equus asinus TaxID=9793 RepID=A0A8C4LTS1_EQUAS